jgi:hypothetical protein
MTYIDIGYCTTCINHGLQNHSVINSYMLYKVKYTTAAMFQVKADVKSANVRLNEKWLSHQTRMFECLQTVHSLNM